MDLSVKQRKIALRALFVLNFLATLHYALPLYINSNFLTQFTSERFVGPLYTIGAILSIAVLIAMPRALSRFGAYRTALTLFTVQAVLILGLAYFETLVFLVPIFVLSTATIRLISFANDELLEHYTTDQETGRVRGKFLSIAASAAVISPITTGFLVGENNYWRAYLLAAVVVTPMIALLTIFFRNFKDPVYDHTPFWSTLREIWYRKNVWKILMSNLLLRFFFSWMVIYTPLYLHQHLGFTWAQIGVVFTIMLLPYALFEFPLGKLADTRFGEKEILSAGFIIIGVSTAMLSFITETSLFLWAAILFITRVGASAVEIMNETYFFKKTDDVDSNILSFFRMVQPLAYILGPLVASVALLVIDIRYLFLLLGTLMLLGLYYSLTLRDTL